MLSCGPAWGQAAQPGVPAASCESLPPEAVTSVPAPFSSYMRLMCRDPVGQGLQPVEGFRWMVPGGQPIGLTATSAGGTDADGLRHFPASWYVELSPVNLPPSDQRRLKRDFRRAIRPGLLTKASVLELRAKTSNGEGKLIFLVLPETGQARPAWLIGLECNGTCFRQDAEPLIFAGSAG